MRGVVRPIGKLCRGLLLALLFTRPSAVSAVTVVTVNDGTDTAHGGVGGCATTGTGTCSLRDAINFANAGSGATIQFAISGAGLHSIALASATAPGHATAAGRLRQRPI